MLLEIAKKALVFEVFKALSFRYMEKRRNTTTESPLPPMCNDRYPNCLIEEKALSVFFILKFSVLKVFLVICI